MAKEKSASRLLADMEVDVSNINAMKRPKTNVNVGQTNAAKRPKIQHGNRDVLHIITCSFDESPAYFQVLTCNTINDLVTIAFEVCDPRGGETASEHLWNFHVGKDVYKSRLFEWEDQSELCAASTQLSSLTLTPNMQFRLEYDFGSTTNHTVTIISIEATTSGIQCSEFPRRKPEALALYSSFTTTAIDLNLKYPILNRWVTSDHMECNFFQVGNRAAHGFLEKKDYGEWVRYVLLPDKPTSLTHSMACLENAVKVKRDRTYSWHSSIVLPNYNKCSKYREHTDRGLCDCTIVNPPNSEIVDQIFPKLAALGGFRKDKNIKKGWIRYMNGILLVVQGKGSITSAPRAPKHTACIGCGIYMPGPCDTIVARVSKKFDSLHDLFCYVEGLL
jgi:Plasmid pRiA4b ORF-3-like protein